MTTPAGKFLVQDDFEDYTLGESLNEKGKFDGIDGIPNWYKPTFNGMLATIEDGTGDGMTGQVLKLARASSINETFAIWGGKADLGGNPDPDNPVNGLTRSSIAIGCRFLYQKNNAGESHHFGLVLRAQDVTPNSEALQAGDVVCQFRSNATDMRIVGPVVGDPVQGPTNVNLSEGTIYWAEALITTGGTVEWRIRSSKGGSILGEMTATVNTVIDPGWWGIYALHVNNINAYTYVDDFELQEIGAARVASNYRESVNSLQVGVSQLDVEASEVYLRRDQFDIGSEVNFQTWLEPNTDLKTFTVAGSAPESQGLVTRYRYETKLSRMANTFPPTIIIRAEDVTGGSNLTARQAVDHVFTEWAALYDWFTFETIPELYLFINNPDTGNYDQTLITPVIRLLQDDDAPVSMRQMIDNLLSVFVGHVFILNSSDNFQIKPPYWSAAYTGSTTALATNNILSEPVGSLDIDTVINRITVRGDTLDFVDDQEVASPGVHFKSWTGTLIPARPPTQQSDLINGADSLFDIEGNGNVWPYTTGTVVGGTQVTLTYNLDIYASGHSSSDNFVKTVSGTKTLNMDTWESLTISTSWGDVGHAVFPIVTGVPFSVTYKIRASQSGVEFLIPFTYVGYTILGFKFAYGMALRVAATASVYQTTASVSGTFGFTEQQDDMPGLEQSFNTYGVREGSQLTAQFFSLDAVTAEQIAEGIVGWRKDPRRIFQNIPLSFWAGYAVQPDMIGDLVQLPDLRIALVDGWSYTDQMTYAGGSLAGAAFDAIALEELTTIVRVPRLTIDWGTSVPTVPFAGGVNVPELTIDWVGEAPLMGEGASIPAQSLSITPVAGFVGQGAAVELLGLTVALEAPVIALAVIPPELTLDWVGQVPTILAT